jgi:hypothetical protein
MKDRFFYPLDGYAVRKCGQMQVERVNSDGLIVNRLPDGSRIFTDQASETVFALNASAGAAWDACSQPTTLSGVVGEMRRNFDPHVTEELAHEAIAQLSEKRLVATSENLPSPSRRRLIAGLSAAAIPLVVSLTLADQRAHTVLAASTAPKPCAAAVPCKQP